MTLFVALAIILLSMNEDSSREKIQTSQLPLLIPFTHHKHFVALRLFAEPFGR